MKIDLKTPIGIHEKGKRNQNQDCIYPAIGQINLINNTHSFLVCDGVGGAAKGEEASRITCETFGDYFRDKKNISKEAFDEALRKTEKAIDDFLIEKPEAKGMATTLTFLGINETQIIVGHIGDSRVYQFRLEEILFKTKDHSLVNELIDNKIITAGEATTHPKRNVITRAIMGKQHPVNADIEILTDIQKGDYFFLCTDGILESFEEEELTVLIGKSDLSNQEKIEQIKAKCSQYSRDNFSAYLIEIQLVGD